MRFGLLLGLLLVLMTGSLMAQTRKISHRSHSGTLLSFAMFLEEDHLGDNPSMRQPYVPYVVDPFIARIRKHYEKYAKNVPSKDQPKAETPPATPDSPAPDSSNSPKLSPSSDQPGQKIPLPQAAIPARVEPQTKTSSTSLVNDIPAPDFLVKSKPKAQPQTSTQVDGPQKSSMWMLFALLVFPVAPGIFWLSFKTKGQQA